MKGYKLGGKLPLGWKMHGREERVRWMETRKMGRGGERS